MPIVYPFPIPENSSSLHPRLKTPSAPKQSQKIKKKHPYCYQLKLPQKQLKKGHIVKLAFPNKEISPASL